MDELLFDAFPILRTAPPRSRELLLAQGIRKSLVHKQVLVRPGNECAYLPLVLKGTLRVYKSSETGKELTLYRIEQGESCILTATCILSGGSFPAVAESEGETDVVLLPARLLVSLVAEHAEWRKFVFGLYSRRLEIVLALVEEVAFHHVDRRIAGYLIKTAGGRQNVVDRTHAEIASELGTSREVVTRILKDFESSGLITTLRGRIRILKPSDLEEKGTNPAAV
ncbi:MAG TPA: Crp/Fnr family transcriptional regulator [Spirochaetia bacterium]|nr:Crp/Fnr family transcriptional regulator [Spirochaetia bacterium]